MKQLKLGYRTIKAIDYSFWAISLSLAFWADWRIGLALCAYDLMRAFEELARPIEDRRRAAQAGKDGQG